MAQLIRLNNTRPTLLHLPDSLVCENREDGPRILGLGTGKSLVPGGNNVEKKYWEAVKPKVKTWVDLGWITEGGDVAQPEGLPDPESLVKFSAPAAIQMIGDCKNPKSLKRWVADVRQAVSEAAKARLEEIGTEKKDKKPEA